MLSPSRRAGGGSQVFGLGEPPQLREIDKGRSVSSSPWVAGMQGTKAEGEEPRDFSESTRKRACKSLGKGQALW